jgi:ArsR family transcriptional regulator, arsenate/arsenite/antimonite-responsive transcriptional repressor
LFLRCAVLFEQILDAPHEPFYNQLTMKHLAQTLKALSDPIRLRIILLLQAEGELCVCDLMAVLKLPQSTVSRHLAYLKRSCWVDTRRQGLWMYYQLSRESCDVCRDLLQILQQHAGNLPEAASDRSTLAAFLKDKPSPCS